MCHWCLYHFFTTSVIYYWTDVEQDIIYLFLELTTEIVKPRFDDKKEKVDSGGSWCKKKSDKEEKPAGRQAKQNHPTLPTPPSQRSGSSTGHQAPFALFNSFKNKPVSSTSENYLSCKTFLIIILRVTCDKHASPGSFTRQPQEPITRSLQLPQ